MLYRNSRRLRASGVAADGREGAVVVGRGGPRLALANGLGEAVAGQPRAALGHAAQGWRWWWGGGACVSQARKTPNWPRSWANFSRL
jgi:hypothetical protein